MMLPDRVKAAGDGGNTGISIGGYDADRKPFVYVDFTCGAWGARPFADGLDGNSHMFANMASHSIEVTEAEQPIQLRPTSSSPTRRAPASSAAACRSGATTASSSRKACCRCAPTGAITGRSASTAAAPARPSENYLNPDGENRLLPSKLTMTIKQGRRVPPCAGRRRRLGRSAGARSRSRAARRAQRAPVAGKGPGRLRCRDRSRRLDGRRGRDRAAPRRDGEGRAAGPSFRKSNGTTRCCSRAPRNSAMTVTYRVGVDIGGTFTDIVLLGSDGTIHTKKISSSVGQLRPGHRRRPERGVPRDRTRGRHHRGDPPRHDRRLQRHPRAQGRAGRADHHQGLPRRAGNPHLAHAASSTTSPGPSRCRWSSATCARWSTSASTIAAMSSARSIRPTPSAPSMRCSPRRSRRSRSACSIPSPIRCTRRCCSDIVAAQGPAPAAQRLVRGAARDQGIRAHLDHGHQRLCDADRRDLSAGAAPGARRRRHSGPPAADAVERRPDDRRRRRRAADEHHRIRAGRRRGRRAGAGARQAARRRSSPSTWAAPPPRPRWSRTARSRAPRNMRSAPAS